MRTSIREFEKISQEQWDKDVELKNYDKVQIPKRATKYSAGYDLCSPIPALIAPGKQVMIPTGLKAKMETDDTLLIFIRSSLGIKKGLSLANGTGIIDSDYYNNEDNEGHIWVCLKNNTEETYSVEIGDKIAQGIFMHYERVELEDEDELEERSGGIGSTDSSN